MMMNKPNVFELIERMAALIRSEERKRCAELKLQLVHFQILEYLAECNKYSDTPAAIANYLGMTRGTISQTLILLEKRGLIQKNQDQHDKRVLHIKLLLEGERLLNKAKPDFLFSKATELLPDNFDMLAGETVFTEALLALQKANNSQSFGICKSCQNFRQTSNGFFCDLTQENLTEQDSEKICQEYSAH